MRFPLRHVGRPALVAAADLAPLPRRLGLLNGLRFGLAAAATLTAVALPDAMGGRAPALVGLGAVYAAASATVELIRCRRGVHSAGLVGGLVLFDGVYLAAAMALTGGPQSALAFLVLVHVVAVTLLLSFRTGLKVALWHALLLFVSSWLQRAGVVPEGPGISPDQAALLGALALLAVAVATAGFAALNEGELRRGKSELRALAAMAARMAASSGPEELVAALLAGLRAAFGPLRAAVVLRQGPDEPGRAFTLGGDDADAGLAFNLGGDEAAAGVVEAAAGGPWEASRRPEPGRTLVSALDARCDPLLAKALPQARNVVLVPLVAEGHSMGTLAVERGGRPDVQVTARTVDLLAQFAAHAALALRSAALRSEVERLASTDALTGLANRRAFQEALARELAVAARRGEPCGLVILDVDHFKAVNDTFGHQGGDEVLRGVGRALTDAGRETDVAARYGGEEFAVVMPGCSASEAVEVAERLRAAIAGMGGPVPVTVSAGVAAFPADGDDSTALVAAADAALYRAKRLGRDRTVRFRRLRAARRPRLRSAAPAA